MSSFTIVYPTSIDLANLAMPLGHALDRVPSPLRLRETRELLRERTARVPLLLVWVGVVSVCVGPVEVLGVRATRAGDTSTQHAQSF